MATADVRRFWTRIAGLGCCLSGAPNPTLHHIHGGSCKDIGIHRSFGRKGSDWLVIPLAAVYHTGQHGIDTGHMSVVEWEHMWGTQVMWMDWVCRQLNENLWTRAGVERDPLSSTVADQMKRSARALGS